MSKVFQYWQCQQTLLVHYEQAHIELRGVELTPQPSQPPATQALSPQDCRRGQDARQGRVAI